jgi:hypothetical protein
MAVPKNYTLGKFANAKRVVIPVTITGNATPASVTCSVDDEVQDSVEIFCAGATAAGQDGLRGGVAAAVGSVLDTSANDANGKAFPAKLTQGTAGALATLGFIVADGETAVQPTNIPQSGDGRNPTYSSTSPIVGAAKKIIDATLTLQDQSGAALTVLQGKALRAAILGAGITPNGNLQFIVSFASLPTAGGQVYKGALDVVYL